MILALAAAVPMPTALASRKILTQLEASPAGEASFMERSMSPEELVAEIQSRPGYADAAHVILLYTGTVPARDKGGAIHSVEADADEVKLGAICQELGAEPGIFAISADTNPGLLIPGQAIVYLAVAADTLDHAQTVLSKLVHRVNEEALRLKEFLNKNSK